MRWRQVIGTALFLVVAACAEHIPPPPPAPPPPPPPPPPFLQPALVEDLQTRVWHHHPDPVPEQQFASDKAYCMNAARNAPPSSSSEPETAMWMSYFSCLRSLGYRPVLH